MSDEPAAGDGGRLVACRACGNRVARSTRRCPACGAREPTSAADPPVERAAAPASGPWRLVATILGAAVAGASISAAVFMMRPAPPPVIERAPTPPPPTAAPAPVVESPRAAPVPAPTPEPSRSRGRADWLFFFKAGDQLVRMGDDAVMGMVIRTVPRHTFADGTEGPAYLLQLPDGGGQRAVDADELERGSRLQ